jgi:hypothetical protein
VQVNCLSCPAGFDIVIGSAPILLFDSVIICFAYHSKKVSFPSVYCMNTIPGKFLLVYAGFFPASEIFVMYFMSTTSAITSLENLNSFIVNASDIFNIDLNPSKTLELKSTFLF